MEFRIINFKIEEVINLIDFLRVTKMKMALYLFTKDASQVQKSVRYWSKEVMTLNK